MDTLPKIVRVGRSLGSMFSNERHAQYHRELYGLVAAVPQAKLHLDASVMRIWKASIDLEIKITEEAAASLNTKQMEKLDNERDDLLTNIFGVVRSQKKSPVELVRKAAEKLDLVFRPYAGIQKQAYDEESLRIAGMLDDITKCTDKVTVLGLAPVFARLKAIETEYAKLQTERRAAASVNKLPQAREVRPHTDEAFEVVCQHIQASYLFTNVATDRTLIENLVAQMNRAAADFTGTHKQSAAQKKSAADKKKVEELLPAFEASEGFAPGTLKLTGKTAKGEGNVKLYELVSLSGNILWVKIDGDKLVKVEAPKER